MIVSATASEGNQSLYRFFIGEFSENKRPAVATTGPCWSSGWRVMRVICVYGIYLSDAHCHDCLPILTAIRFSAFRTSRPCSVNS